MEIYEELIATHVVIAILKQVIDGISARLKQDHLTDLIPGLILCSVIDESTATYHTEPLEVDYDTIEEAEQVIKTAVTAHAHAGTMIILFMFGAVGEVDGDEGRELGFILQAATIDGRGIVGFLPLQREEGNRLLPSGKLPEIEVGRFEGDDGAMMERVRKAFVASYYEYMKGRSAERLH